MARGPARRLLPRRRRSRPTDAHARQHPARRLGRPRVLGRRRRRRGPATARLDGSGGGADLRHRSAAVGTTAVTAGRSDLVVAEGIFAAEIVARLREEGLLHSAWCVCHPRWVTFGRRLARDLSERRKPPMVLVRRGLALCREEPSVIARMARLGAAAATPKEVERAVGRRNPAPPA